MTSMGIDERRQRERERRRAEILQAAWATAREVGWGAFSVERVAARAELGRATIYGYFESLEALVAALASDALASLSERVAAAPGLAEALDVPVRFAQANPPAFSLLFPTGDDPRAAFANESLAELRARARKLIGSLTRLADRAGTNLPPDAQSAAAFLMGISLAGALVPDLKSSTPLRRKWQQFCLSDSDPAPTPGKGKKGDPGT